MPDEAPDTPWEPWLARARDDLAVAETLKDAESPAWAICYHVQQAVENGMKALLVLVGEDPPKTHNLVRLNDALDPPLFSKDDEEQLASLTLWSVEQRYPADQPEPTTGEAERALTLGRQAFAAVSARVADATTEQDEAAEDDDIVDSGDSGGGAPSEA